MIRDLVSNDRSTALRQRVGDRSAHGRQAAVYASKGIGALAHHDLERAREHFGEARAQAQLALSSRRYDSCDRLASGFAPGTHVPSRDANVIPSAEPSKGPRFADFAELRALIQKKSNLRELFEGHAIGPAELPAALASELATFGERNVSIYRVPVGDSSGFVFECASLEDRANLLSLCDSNRNQALARRDWTQFDWSGAPAELTSQPWMKWVQNTVEKNIFEVVGKENILRPEQLHSELSEAAQRYPERSNWFQIPDSNGFWVCQYAKPPQSRVHVLAPDGTELAQSSRDFSDYRFMD